MAASGTVIAIDTNLLVYAHRSAVPEHGGARRAIESAAADGRGWGTTVANVAEFWSVVTHPAASGRPSRPREAAAFLGALTRDLAMQLWLPGAGFGERLMRTAQDLEVAGARVFDVQVGLVALENGAQEIWTHDSSFVRLRGLRVRDPL
jgi:toxin-antitoxin system PIN domain toxin